MNTNPNNNSQTICYEYLKFINVANGFYHYTRCKKNTCKGSQYGEVGSDDEAEGR